MLRQQCRLLLVLGTHLLLVSTAYSDSDTASTSTSTSNLKTDDMPASVVLLLLFMFSSLALICVRHIRRDYAKHERFLSARTSGKQVSLDSIDITSKSYGSTRSPQLDASNIDEYIDDQLYGNWPLLQRLEHYRRSLQNVIVSRLERTPEPVLFEVDPPSVGAFCENPSIPFAPGDAESAQRPFVHSAQYRATPSPAMETLMLRNARKNQRRRECEEAQQRESEEKAEYEQIAENAQNGELIDTETETETVREDINLRSRMDLADFAVDREHAMFGDGYADAEDYGSGDAEYDALADVDGVDGGFEDGDGIGSEDDGEERMTHKVVRLDVDVDVE